jgi:hypothetical protein
MGFGKKDSHAERDEDEKRHRKTAICKSRRKVWARSFLIALRRNQPCQSLDFGLLASKPRHNTSLLFKLLGLWILIFVCLTQNNSSACSPIFSRSTSVHNSHKPH